MDPATAASIQLGQQGFSLIFQQGIAFVVLGLVILFLICVVVYMAREMGKTRDKSDQTNEKFYAAAMRQTEVISAFTQRLDDVIKSK